MANGKALDQLGFCTPNSYLAQVSALTSRQGSVFIQHQQFDSTTPQVRVNAYISLFLSAAIISVDVLARSLFSP